MSSFEKLLQDVNLSKHLGIPLEEFQPTLVTNMALVSEIVEKISPTPGMAILTLALTLSVYSKLYRKQPQTNSTPENLKELLEIIEDLAEKIAKA